MIMKRCFSLAAVLMLAVSGFAPAQERQVPARDEASARLGFIEGVLREAQPRARTWWYGWLGAYSAGTAVSWGLAKAHWDDVKVEGTAPDTRTVRDRGFAEDMLVGGGTFALGVVGLAISPFSPASASAKLARLPDATPDDRRIKRLRAEELLRQCAKRGREGRGWVTHLLNIGVNAVAGVVTSVAFDRPWTDGLVTFALGESVSLLNIFSQPTRAIRDLEAYESGGWRKRTLSGNAAAFPGPRSASRFSIVSGPVPGGIAIAVKF